MITLSTDKGLVKIDSWRDIESRPGFIKDLNPKDKKLEAIIGRYMFGEKIRCGLSNCHTPHSKGYIVTTKDGNETNIGKDCGKTYFGVDFDTLSRKFDKDVTESENRERLWSFNFQIDELEKKIHSIRTMEHGANWVHKQIQSLVSRNKGCPEEVVSRLVNMVKIRSSVLTNHREATSQEIEDIEAVENRKVEGPHYIEEPIAVISGTEALYPENNLRELLIKDLESNIGVLKKTDIDQMTYEELRYWSKWTGTVDNTLDKASMVIEAGKQLLKEENLKPFFQILKAKDDIKLFRQYLRGVSGN